MNALFQEISSLSTEQINPATASIDAMTTREILQCINSEDALVPAAVSAELEHIEKAVELIVHAFASGGRLFYVGAGTSGRLGIVDASECPPTFGVSADMVQAIIAGGPQAVFRAQEGAEDREDLGAAIIEEHQLNTNDVLCGIAASGRTPFVRGAVSEASRRGIPTILVTTNSRENIASLGVIADVIYPHEVRNRTETGVEHAYHYRHDSLRQNLRQYHGGSAAHQCQAGRTRQAHRDEHCGRRVRYRRRIASANTRACKNCSHHGYDKQLSRSC
jgi:phosphoheptose isomerase